LHIVWVVSFMSRRRETLEEARRRRQCRFMLELPPETVYHHVREGLATVAGLGVLLVAVIAWQPGQFAALALALLGGAFLAVLTPTVLTIRRRYRHVVAGMLVLALMLGLLVAAVQRYGYPAAIAFVISPTPSAIADAAAPR